MKSMNEPARAIKRQALFDELAEILAFVQHTFQAGGTAHEVESGLLQQENGLARGDLYGGSVHAYTRRGLGCLRS
jgi:hypothetical protein